MKNQFSILYTSPSLLAIDKPSGLLSVPDRYNAERPNLATMLLNTYPAARPLHRLDTETSGVLLFCLLPEAFGWYSDQFENRTVTKKYLAICEGRCLASEGLIDQPLFTQHDGKVIITRKGRPGQTAWKVVERFTSHTLFETHPLTGRTHQIRVHLSSLGHPIVGDTIYGSSGPLFLSSLKGRKKYKLSADLEHENPLIARIALHAVSILIMGYETKQAMEISSDLPKDMRVSLKQLRQWSAIG